MKNWKRWFYLLSASSLLILGSGCAALVIGGAAGVGGVAYARGELKSLENAPLERTLSATQEAVRELEFVLTDLQKDALEARVDASGVGKDMKITLKEIDSRTTEVRVRVGVFGDEAVSRRILETIRRNL